MAIIKTLNQTTGRYEKKVAKQYIPIQTLIKQLEILEERVEDLITSLNPNAFLSTKRNN